MNVNDWVYITFYVCVCLRVCAYHLHKFNLSSQAMSWICFMYICMYLWVYIFYTFAIYPKWDMYIVHSFKLKWRDCISKLHVSNGVYKYWTFSWFSHIISMFTMDRLPATVFLLSNYLCSKYWWRTQHFIIRRADPFGQWFR